MPVFTAIGVGLGLAGTAATVAGVGVAATAGYAAYSAGAGGSDDNFNQSVPSVSPDTGALSEAEAQTAAKKRAFRSGVLFTSPTGLDSDAATASAKLR